MTDNSDVDARRDEPASVARYINGTLVAIELTAKEEQMIYHRVNDAYLLADIMDAARRDLGPESVLELNDADPDYLQCLYDAYAEYRNELLKSNSRLLLSAAMMSARDRYAELIEASTEYEATDEDYALLADTVTDDNYREIMGT